jgi:hypothetical protein
MHKHVILIFLCLTTTAAERFPFVIPGDDGLKGTATDMSLLSPAPAGSDGFVRVRDDHFATESERLRIWGVNVCFGGNFPKQDDAPKIAAHLAKLGINGVRFHHHDSQNAPSGIWKRGLEDGQRVFDPDMVDRLDRYLAELHANGIYANLNLHCSRELREAEGFPNHNVGWRTGFNKYTLYFELSIQAKLKEFCREYLLHKNPYRGLRRVDDPGIALIEISNENSFSNQGPEIAAKLPEPYRGSFKSQWNAWLAKTYANTDTLRTAWGEFREPEGAAIVSGNAWRKDRGKWISHGQSTDALVVSYGPDPRVKITIAESAKNPWEQQLMWMDVPIKAGRLYTLRFRYRGDASQELACGLETAWPATWKSRGVNESVTCGAEWQTFTRSFTALDDAHPARLCFSFGGQRGSFELADMALVRGGTIHALPPGQTLKAANIEIPTAGWPANADTDVRKFMAEVELRFISEMKRFLREDLGVRVPISATQVNYHPPAVAAASASDFVDLHSYWHHPLFPGKMWDSENWVIRNKAIEANPFDNQWPGNSMLMRAGWRHFGRPFTYSEWNSGEPMIFGASLVPIAATIAALQDWDAIFFFQYDDNNKDPFRDHFRGHFSMNGQPAKLAMLAASANLFRRADLAPLSSALPGPIGENLVDGGHALNHRIGMRDGIESLPAPAPRGVPMRSPQDEVTWDPAKGVVQVHSPKTWTVQGMIANSSFRFGDVSLVVSDCENDYGIVILTSLDNKPIADSARLLLTAVGSAENTGMKWNADKTSVGNNWGHGPTHVNAIPCELRNFPKRRIFALDGSGNRVNELESATFGPAHETLWYEIIQ